MYQWLLTICRGLGQVIFQRNALSGALMLVGIACNWWLLALLALAGCVIGTLTARWLRFPEADIRGGVYGFNGTLVGIAVGVFLRIGVWSMVLLVVGAGLSSYIAGRFGRQKRLPGYTFPFIASAWLILIGCHYLWPTLLIPLQPSITCHTADLIGAFSLNLGQVMLQGGSTLPGFIFLLAIAVNSRPDAFYAALGAGAPLALALATGVDLAAFNAGLLGYNGVLCSLAVGNGTINTRGIISAIIVIVISIALQMLGMKIGAITLTAPFVLSVWIYKLIDHPSKQSDQCKIPVEILH